MVSRICQIYISILSLVVVLQPIPETEGWFIELNKSDSLQGLYATKVMQLPPLYPILIKGLGVLTNQLIVFRLFGLLILLIIIISSFEIIKLSNLLWAKESSVFGKSSWWLLTAMFFSYYVFGNSYLIPYDFTALVHMIQGIALVFFLRALKVRDSDFQNRAFKWMGCLLTLGVYLKHSNMGVFFIFVWSAVFVAVAGHIFNLRQIKTLISYIVFSVLILNLIFVLFGINLRELYGALFFSANSKGGPGQVFWFLKSYFLAQVDNVMVFGPKLLMLVLVYWSAKAFVNSIERRGMIISVFIRWASKFLFLISLQYMAFIRNNNIHFWVQVLSWIYFLGLFFVFLGMRLRLWASTLGKLNADLITSKFSVLVIAYGVVYGNITSAGLGTNGTYFIYLLSFCFSWWEAEKYLRLS